MTINFFSVSPLRPDGHQGHYWGHHRGSFSRGWGIWPLSIERNLIQIIFWWNFFQHFVLLIGRRPADWLHLVKFWICAFYFDSVHVWPTNFLITKNLLSFPLLDKNLMDRKISPATAQEGRIIFWWKFSLKKSGLKVNIFKILINKSDCRWHQMKI